AMAMEQAIYLVLALVLPLLLLKHIRKRSGGAGQKLPPGPWRLPVIGSLHHLAGKPLVHRAFADIAHRLGDAPLVYLKLGEVPVVVASSAEAAREVMKTQDVTFATRPWSPTTKILMSDGVGVAFAPYGAHWRQLRKICIMELLSARRVQSFRNVREEEAGRLVAAIAAGAGKGEPVNVSERLAVLIADMTVRAMIGDRFSRREEFLEVLQQGARRLRQRLRPTGVGESHERLRAHRVCHQAARGGEGHHRCVQWRREGGGAGGPIGRAPEDTEGRRP
uniref:Cytochrome P450 n=1 Tax=Aegilops tauschii subsp. strangulata TaxID=200361 RepID=A0A453AIA6_AEGTS